MEPGFRRKIFFKKVYVNFKNTYHDWFGDVHIFFKNKIQDTRPEIGPFLDKLYTTLSIIILIFFSIIFIYSLFVHSHFWSEIFIWFSLMFGVVWIFGLPILSIQFILEWFRGTVDNDETNFFYYFIYTLIFWFFSFLYITIHDYFVI